MNDLTREFTGGRDDVRALFTECSIAGGLDAIRSIGGAPGHVAATTAWTLARSRAATSRRHRERHEAELDRAQTEISLLREELRIKDARWSRLPSRRRPHYTAVERLRILELTAARGWSREQVARIFLLDEQTVRSWQGRVDE